MKISLFTASGAYNLGDELILRQECLYLLERYPHAELTVFTYDKNSVLLPKETNISFVSYFPNQIRKHPLRNVYSFFRTIFHLSQSDLVVIGGGGLIYDSEAGQSFQTLLRQWKLRVAIAKFFKKKIAYWSLGIHIDESKESLLLPLFSGENVFVSVRDKRSQAVLERIGVKSTLVYDPVFLFEAKKLKLIPKARPKVGLALRAWYLKNEKENIEKMVSHLQKEGYEVIFLNHSFHKKDVHGNDYLFLRSLSEKYHVSSTSSIAETLETYPMLDMVVSMRLHGTILSLCHGIPFFALSYGKKTDEILRQLDYEFVLRADTFDLEIFKERFHRLETYKKDVRFALERKYDTIKKSLLISLNRFFDGLDSFEG